MWPQRRLSLRAMAEPARRRGRKPRGRGGGVGRGARGVRGARGGRGRPPRVQQPPARHGLDSVLVDLVSDSDEDVLEVSTACDVADPAEVPSPASPVPAKPRVDSDSDSEGSEARPAGAPRAVVRQRRRRLVLDPETAPVVPVYSGKVRRLRAPSGGQGQRRGVWGFGVQCWE